ncbi:QacE family quaternary ammonium compound efflux SMR transporter [Bacillus cereus]|uniref:SMR family transporter n=1 Tax=Bacillus cereus TaxID=1396 RepID=UPI0018F5CA25|nr:QacE family quaternary ammonium compound efflux SMR transporter [Bacillus cereus]
MKKRSWHYVILTCMFEFIWVFGFNTAQSWWHWALIISVIILDFHFLSKACESIPTGTVYAIFAGSGTVGTTVMDAFLLGGNFNAGKFFFVVVIAIGVIGLKLADNKEEEKVLKGAA